MKKNVKIVASLIVAALLMNSCGTTEKSMSKEKNAVVASTPTEISVTANPEFITIKEAISLFENSDDAPTIAKKYGYKLTNNYEIYRLDKFSKLYYKNCRLAKILTGNQYEDYPKPLRKGVSSYVAFKDGAIIIGVFNQAAYDNLVQQVKAAGFILDMPGNEEIYTNGKRTIACYEGAKTVRVQ